MTLFILLALLIGIAVGFALNRLIADPAALVTITDDLSILTDMFLRLIKMIIAPLVFATLVAGVAHMGDTAALGRIGGRTIGWFILASLVSLTLGLIVVNILKPGVGLNLRLPAASAATGVSTAAFSLHDFFTHIVPASVVDAMAKNDILPIVIFALFFGVGLAAIGEAGAPILKGVEALSAVMLKVTGYVMRFAPVAVFAAASSAVAKQGIGILATFGFFIIGFYIAIAILLALLFGVSWLIVGPSTKRLFGYLREPFLVAFTTASSESAFPRTLEALERFGVPERVAGFVLPLGYSFNLDGTMLYCTFATMFIAQAYGIDISIGQQVVMLLVLMVTSKGVAGVPRASLVVIASTLSFFHIPEGGLLLILAVDHFLDMGRSATSVIGNAVAASVVAKWEGVLGDGPIPVVTVAREA
nr:dicarboxylate/amino acid:cation symporter [Sphingomonas vulcanisoli]